MSDDNTNTIIKDSVYFHFFELPSDLERIPSDYVEGPEMEVERSSELKTGLSFSGAPMIGLILVIGLAAVIYWGYRRRG